MFKILLMIISFAVIGYSAEISSSYALLDKHEAFKPELKTEPIETRTTLNERKFEEKHPVYKYEEVQKQGRARIEPVRPRGPVIKNDHMLADQPAMPTEVTRADGIDGNGYQHGPVEVAYPDIPYAPGYYYDTGFAASNNYDMYGPNTYLMEPDTSTVSLLWSQVPDGRTLVSYVGRTIIWVFNSMFVLFLGSLLTVGVCSYTNLCTIAFTGIGPIHEEMRALISPERLEKISHAADFVKTAIDKYQKIQKVTDEVPSVRKRRAIFN